MENGSSINPPSAGDKTKSCLYGQVALISLLIIGVWCLVSMPIIFYHLPKSETPSNSNGSTLSSVSNSVCSAPVQYTTTRGICIKELANILTSSNCLPDPGGSVAVMRNGEVTATQLINGFTLFEASAECLNKVVLFLCLHVFGLCGGSGVSIQPTSSQCEEVRDTTCQQQWMIIERLDIGLPDCEMFPAESLSCPALNNSLSINGTVASNMSGDLSSGTVAILECSGDFYQENGSSYCTRSCNSWVKFGSAHRLAFDVLCTLLTSFSLLTSAAIIILSCLSHKRMLIFPAIFVVYMSIDKLVLDLFTIVGFMDREKLFCTSRSLTKSLREVTSFCTVFGIVFTYTICQMILWWIFHTATLFWKVVFPLHALSFENSGKNKYIHRACVIIGILFPLVPIITTMADTAVDLLEQNENFTFQIRMSLFISEGLGFGPNGFPPILCIAKNLEANFYSLILMVDLILGCGCTMLIIVFWSVRQLYIKRKHMQRNKINDYQGPQFTLGTAEKKLLIVFCYYVVVAALVLTIFTWDTRNGSPTNNTLQRFLICELGSYNSSNSCIYSIPVTYGYYFFQILSLILLDLLPVVNLLYVVNIQELKKLWRNLVHGH